MNASVPIMHSYLLLAGAVLALHLAIIAFNVFGLIVIPLGGLLGWKFVHVGWWRLLHLISMAMVALQALAGRVCFLTIVELRLAGKTAAHTPLVMSFVNRLIFWPLPFWAFTLLYALAFLYVVVLLRLVPIRPSAAARGRGAY